MTHTLTNVKDNVYLKIMSYGLPDLISFIFYYYIEKKKQQTKNIKYYLLFKNMYCPVYLI